MGQSPSRYYVSPKSKELPKMYPSEDTPGMQIEPKHPPKFIEYKYRVPEPVKSEKAKIIFEGVEETLHTINTGGSLADLLGFPDQSKCSLLGSEIQIAKFLGRGNQGEAYLVKFPHLNVGTRLYAVKKMPIVLHKPERTKEKFIEIIIADNLEKKIASLQTQQDMVDFDNANPNDIVTLTLPMGICKVLKDTSFPAIPSSTGRQLIIPKGSYVCDDSSVPEFVLGVYAGTIFQRGECINFFNVYSAFICPTAEKSAEHPADYDQYVFMDKFDSDVEKEFEGTRENKFNICKRLNERILYKKYNFNGNVCPFENIVNGIYIQTLFAIASYQTRYEISHNDLKPDNVFIEYVNANTMFGGVNLADCKWYSYTFGGKTIYFPAIPLIVKIGDYGRAAKFSKPIIGDLSLFETGFDQHNGDGPWIPNFFIPSYDLLFISFTFTRLIDGYFHASTMPELLAECFYNMIPELDRTDHAIGNQLFNLNYINPNNARPKLEKVRSVKNVLELLDETIVKYTKYKKYFPKKGELVCELGHI